MKNHTISISLVVVLYMMIFNPPIFSINCILILMIPSWIYIFINQKFLNKVINVDKLICVEILLGVILLFGMCVAIINQNSIFSFRYIFYWMMGDIPFAVSILVYLRKKNLGYKELVDNIIFASFLMSITSVLALVIPTIHNFFIKEMIEYGVEHIEILSTYRSYGYAANLTSFTSFHQAIIAIICLFYYLKGKKTYLMFVPTLIISAVVNTRSSILYLTLGVLILFFLFALKFRTNYFFRCMIIIGVGAIVIFIGGNLIQKYNIDTFDWISNGIEQITSFLIRNNSDSGYFAALKEMTSVSVIPKGINFFIGVGTGILGGSKYGIGSDVGFINDLWRGGICYSILVISAFILMLRQIYKSPIIDKLERKFLVAFYLVIFVLTNIKGSFFIHSDVTVVFWLIYIALVFDSDNPFKYKYKIKIR